MKAKILASFKENGNVCYLSSVNLRDYITSIPANYDQYEVQREIVKNIYLDNLVTTILRGTHIPPIVLVLETGRYQLSDDEIEVEHFKILDGLQRTFRLKIIFDTIEFFNRRHADNSEFLQYTRLQISKTFKTDLEKFNSSSAMLFTIKQYFVNELNGDVGRLNGIFDRSQWFELWTGLSPDDEVNKMLVLNAGHKPVKTKHQLELLYRYVLDVLPRNEFPAFKVVREKEKSSALYSKTREVGEFHFSHLITSILSLSEGKPITGNVSLVQKTQMEYFNEEIFEAYLSLDFLRTFVSSILEIDRVLSDTYGLIGTRWMGRETSLVGLYAATGRYRIAYKVSPVEAINHLVGRIHENPSALKLDEFERARNTTDLAKINIGNVNKMAVFEGVFDLLIGGRGSLDWEGYFRG